MKPNDIIINFGLGLGYLLDETFNKYPARIFVYEPDIKLLHFVLNNPAELDTVQTILHKYGFHLLGHKSLPHHEKLNLLLFFQMQRVIHIKRFIQ